MIQSIFVTGANGFVGRALCRRLLADGLRVCGAVRSGKSSRLPKGVEPFEIGRFDERTNWQGAFDGIDAIVHLAARVHVMDDRAVDPHVAYQQVNVAGTEQIARSAVEAGVRRFVFLSTVKVNGEENVRPYRETDPPAPRDSYAISKLQAEQKLKEIAAGSKLEPVILRPPLVYGSGVRANFLALIQWVAKGVPLPFASIRNRRSFIYVENLADVIAVACSYPDAGGKVFFVSDGEDVSTPELIRRIATALKTSVRLLPFPSLLLFGLGRIVGKGAAVDRLLGSLTVDISKAGQELNWKPPFSMTDGLRNTAEWYHGQSKLR